MFVDEKRQGELAVAEDDILSMLIKAQEKIVRGWCQNIGWIRGEHGDSFCAAGAVTHAYSVGYEPVLQYLARAIGVVHNVEIPLWNDGLARTKEDVIRAYDRAIELRKHDIAREALG